MLGFNNQTTVAPVKKDHHIGVRRKHAMKKAMGATTTTKPVKVGHKHNIMKRHRQGVPKVSLFQRIKMAIMTRLRGFTKRPMITGGATTKPVDVTTGHRHHHIKRHL